MKFILVDDESCVRTAMTFLLDSFDHEVVGEYSSAENFLQNVDAIKELSFDCVISDFSMGGMDGVMFALKMYEDYGFPTIILTGSNSVDKYIEATGQEIPLVQKTILNGNKEFQERIIAAANRAIEIVNDRREDNQEQVAST